MNDLRVALDTFMALMVMEVVVKPIAVRVGRWFLSRVDKRIDVIPDFLYQSHHCHEEE